MMQKLKTLFSAIAISNTELELQETVVPIIGEYFSAKRYRLFLLDRISSMVKSSPIAQLALSLEFNPVLCYLVENHIPVHEGILLTSQKWKSICPRFDHGHVMLGPIVNNGSLVGGLAFTRDRDNSPFDNQNLLDLSALCLHISTQLLKIQSQQTQFSENSKKKVTARELQIAELVAQGLTNKEIGKILWITENSVKQALKRMFRKLQVSSRAEMIALLSGYELSKSKLHQEIA